jgi:predicted DCC family thiol-disulfide oxidoreductase YuxK
MPPSVGVGKYGARVAELTVLYDEGCDFCTRLAARLAGRPKITVAPIGSTTGSLMLRDLSPAERYASVHVVDAFGRRRSAGGALPQLLRRLPGGRLVAAVCEALPGPTEHAYRLVARNRRLASRIACLGVCVTPSTPTERQVGSR